MVSLEPYQERLIGMKQEGKSYNEMIDWLLINGVDISKRSLERRFSDWGATLPHNLVTPEVVCQVEELYHHSLLSDAEIAKKIAENNGPNLSARQVKRLRDTHSLTRRVQRQDPQSSIDRTVSTREVVFHLINEGTGRSYGSRWAQTHLRRRYGINARRADIQAALREFDPNGVARRARRERQPR